MLGTSALRLTNDSLILNTESLRYEGGGIAAGGTPDISVSDSALRDCRAGTHGGAIYLSGGVLDFAGGWTLRENMAGGNGGAVAVVGTANPRVRAESYGLVYNNRALGGHGGMI